MEQQNRWSAAGPAAAYERFVVVSGNCRPRHGVDHLTARSTVSAHAARDAIDPERRKALAGLWSGHSSAAGEVSRAKVGGVLLLDADPFVSTLSFGRCPELVEPGKASSTTKGPPRLRFEGSAQRGEWEIPVDGIALT